MTARWVTLVVLLFGAAWGTFRLFDRLADLGPSLAANQLLLPALSLMLAVMVLALAGILIRNLVRLIVDRKKGILGARLRTKLVFFFSRPGVAARDRPVYRIRADDQEDRRGDPAHAARGSDTPIR